MTRARKKRCQKGKSCGATCISNTKICRKDISTLLSSSLSEVKGDVASGYTSATDPKTSASNLISDLETKVLAKDIIGAKEARDKALEEVKKLPDADRRKEIDRIDKILNTVTLDLKSNKAEDFIEAGKATMEPYRDRLRSIKEELDSIKEERKSIKKELSQPGLSASDKKDLRKLDEKLWKDKILLGAEYGKIMEDIRQEMMVSKVPQDVLDRAVKRIIIDGFGTSGDKEVRDSLMEFAKMFNGRGLGDEPTKPGETKGIRMAKIEKTPEDDKRASANPGSGRVKLVESGLKVTSFHEFAHILESQHPPISQFSEKWRNSRAFSAEKIEGDNPNIIVRRSNVDPAMVKLRDLTGNPNFGQQEMAVVDTFINPYMGKVYNSGTTPPFIPSTEVMSMAIQMFTNRSDMAILHKSHPDLFEFIVGLATAP